MIDKLKFILFFIVVLVLVGLIGYWSVITIQSGSEFKTNQKIEQLEQEKEDLEKQVEDLSDELITLQSQIVVEKPVEEQKEPTPEPTESTTYKNQKLINELQKLITDNVYMKLKSSGTRVGTVQNFLNVYNKTSNKIDNSYGVSTQKAVASFQKDQGLTADGQAGSSTFTKMITWLKKQG
ncbi:MAG: Spore cortex-lytic enzyme [Candidatus Nomurabacteria bacterium GW2011_GWE1_32_28]|uniref:Spore cortex-lytic enzyme n=1 Tax=Candidatus Nomurabacteria bacterium GW2011_GWF1_31_48 TaxID=1618767 RepID=A0A0F9YF07_9BACT|nr:MAG: Spore cortex-lytic enzyme [Candidatus Nomurabacteria bacterium GW2011_GWF2_30_133]KKP28383.1 MAG: Spore cortex-lytic enzyme [Candidatus Nomurabacteria bacterium GW2011_GWE2_31_40]KKP29968.1 MAG: Spore cortex-lytic enzyme [Candidatus Nomurabacteria bacterium GW2011_GWF1_31_48]KKP35105.1 MAG: Spore cortex-lytic enzyme [Candidatus Nomurabacteria bacterium GW2011_GWE1_32_28]HAS80917.1 hypothetical protein [Candidatus Nomurabacteria bacterium]